MAITLPRASPASTGTSRSPRRVSLPTAGDVPAQQVARDPGVSVPDQGAVGRGLEDLGAGVTDLAAGLQAREVRLAQAEARLNARRESVERMRAGREFHDFGNELFTETESSRDFSRQEVAEEYGAALNAKAEEIIANHQGSEESKLRLMERLSPILQAATDKAGVASVKAQDALVDREFDEVVNGVSASVREGEDPRIAIDNGMAFLEAEKDSLRPGQEISIEKNIRATAWGAKLDSFMASAAHDAAEDLLADPEVQAALGPDAQRKGFDRIAAAKREGTAFVLTDAQMAAVGFPPESIAAGLVVQRKKDGSINVVFNPPRDADEQIRDKQIKSVERQRLALGDTPEAALDFATNLVDGNIRIEIVPATGKARAINDITGEVSEVPLGQVGAVTPPPQEETLFEIVERGNTAGIFPAAKALVGRTVGQAFEGAIDPQLVEDRQAINLALLGLIRSLAINPRFPVAEMERIREEIEIAPAVWDSPGALLARMKAVRKGLEIRQANEQNAADDPNLPQKTRAAGAQAATHIGNFLNRLGTPLDAEPQLPTGVPAGSTKLPFTLDGRDVWGTPDGKRVIVE